MQVHCPICHEMYEEHPCLDDPIPYMLNHPSMQSRLPKLPEGENVYDLTLEKLKRRK